MNFVITYDARSGSTLVSKLLTENFLKKCSNKLFSVKIYRFTNIFGKWAKPNYNSVIATFCYLISRNKKIKLSKNNNIIDFLYIDDVMEVFEIDIKKKPRKNFEVVSKFNNTYKITKCQKTELCLQSLLSTTLIFTCEYSDIIT